MGKAGVKLLRILFYWLSTKDPRLGSPHSTFIPDRPLMEIRYFCWVLQAKSFREPPSWQRIVSSVLWCGVVWDGARDAGQGEIELSSVLLQVTHLWREFQTDWKLFYLVCLSVCSKKEPLWQFSIWHIYSDSDLLYVYHFIFLQIKLRHFKNGGWRDGSVGKVCQQWK